MHPDLCLCTDADLRSSEPALQAGSEAGEDEPQSRPCKNPTALTGREQAPDGVDTSPSQGEGGKSCRVTQRTRWVPKLWRTAPQNAADTLAAGEVSSEAAVKSVNSYWCATAPGLVQPCGSSAPEKVAKAKPGVNN